MKRIISLLTIVLAGVAHSAQGQNLAAKTNILSDAFLTPNLGIEAGLAPRWTIDVSGQFNAWTLSHDRRWKHWLLQPEVRYWFCDRFSGHFVGAHLLGGQYNIGGIDLPFSFLGTDFKKLKDYRYQGWYGGLGIAYGYAWILDRHWNIEAELGLGWTYTRYDSYPCATCGTKIDSGKSHNYVGVTKAAINLVYIF